MLQKINNTEEEFEKVFSLIQKSFPPDEYRSFADQRKLLSNPHYSIYAVYDGDRRVTACLAVWEFENFAFFEHFAVDPEHRNTGLGSKILAETISFLKKPVCLEVELPETELAKRRIGFYKRNGFFLNKYNYVMPPQGEGKKPLPLYIMTYGREITEEKFLNIKSTVYKKVYQYKE